jgi:hypothetical protein
MTEKNHGDDINWIFKKKVFPLPPKLFTNKYSSGWRSIGKK